MIAGKVASQTHKQAATGSRLAARRLVWDVCGDDAPPSSCWLSLKQLVILQAEATFLVSPYLRTALQLQGIDR